jgi:hypothetical protein
MYHTLLCHTIHKNKSDSVYKRSNYKHLIYVIWLHNLDWHVCHYYPTCVYYHIHYSSKVWFCSWKKSLMCTKTTCLIKILLQFEITGFYLNIFWNVMYSCDGKVKFSATISQVFSVTWSFRNHSNMMIWCSRRISYYQCWNVVLLNIFEEIVTHFFDLMNRRFKRKAFIWN